MAATPMTRGDEDRICRAIVKVADLVEDGEPPDRAIARAAAADGLPRGHLGLMVHAYNIGRTNRQREEGTSPAEKAASFPIATLDGVLSALYPDEPATKAAAERATAVDAVYSAPPTAYLAFKAAGLRQERMTKAAAVASPAPKPVDPRAAMATAIRRSEKRARVVAEARRVASEARDRFAGALTKLAAAFDAPGAPAPADVRANVEAVHGHAGLVLLDQVARDVPRLAKRAASARFAAHPVREHRAIYVGVAAALQLADTCIEVGDWHAAMAKEAAVLDRVELSDYRPAPRSLVDRIDLDLEKRAVGLDVGDRLLGPNVSGALANSAAAIHGGDGDAAASRALGQLSSPEHEQDLRAIQARAMLHEMLHDDEILKGHDPYEVARHFNRLSRFAPRVAEQPLAAIPSVRKSVQQGHLDSFDARELADTEGKLKNIHPHGGHRSE